MEIQEEIFISSLKNILAKEGKEICEEIESKYHINYDITRLKAYSYCRFFESFILAENNPELYKRCLQYMDEVHDFNRYESIFKSLEYERKEREKFGISNRRVKEIEKMMCEK